MGNSTVVELESEAILELKGRVFLDGFFYNDKESTQRAFSRIRSDLKQMIDSANEETGEFMEDPEDIKPSHITEVIYASSLSTKAAIISIPWRTYVERGKPDRLEVLTHY